MITFVVSARTSLLLGGIIYDSSALSLSRERLPYLSQRSSETSSFLLTGARRHPSGSHLPPLSSPRRFVENSPSPPLRFASLRCSFQRCSTSDLAPSTQPALAEPSEVGTLPGIRLLKKPTSEEALSSSQVPHRALWLRRVVPSFDPPPFNLSP